MLDTVSEPASQNADDATLYFGYGSNLWKAQMLKRCPDSSYEGIARLEGYRWIINDRGYANVVKTTPEATDTQHLGSIVQGWDEGDAIWGLVYSLTDSDEAKLDINEGVPYAYTKENLSVDFWPTINGAKPDVAGMPEVRSMLVYIDRLRTEPDKPKKEYVFRMNMGIKDAVEEGIPEGYVRDVMRKFILEGDVEGEGGNGDVRELARRQAERFEDEE